MMAELDERRRIESEWKALGRDPERIKGTPNVRLEKQKGSVIHRTFDKMKYEGEVVWLSLCGGWKLPSLGWALTSEAVTCRRCLKKMGEEQ